VQTGHDQPETLKHDNQTTGSLISSAARPTGIDLIDTFPDLQVAASTVRCKPSAAVGIGYNPMEYRNGTCAESTPRLLLLRRSLFHNASGFTTDNLVGCDQWSWPLGDAIGRAAIIGSASLPPGRGAQPAGSA